MPASLRVVGSLGVGQILVWGSSYYLPAVLAGPVSVATGWPLGWVVGSLSLGLLVSGLLSPLVGRLIERWGGRDVLAGSAVLLAAGLSLAGLAASLPVYVAGWLLIGAAMAAGLYDPAFATLGQLYGERAGRSITHLTLLGGFSSTICWPLSAWLVAHAGWRGAFLAYAAIAMVVVLPAYRLGVPGRHAPEAAAAQGGGAFRPGDLAVFAILAAGLTLASFIMTVIAVELLLLLQARGLTLASAVALGALVGPSQVGARFLQSLLERGRHPVWTMVASSLLVAIGLSALMGGAGAITAGVVLYGAGSGIRSIAQGTVPLALFGRDRYPVMMGRLAAPKLVAQAAAPTVGALLLERFGPAGMTASMVAAAVVNIALALALVPWALGRPARGG